MAGARDSIALAGGTLLEEFPLAGQPFLHWPGYEEQLDREEEKAIRLNREFDRELRSLQLWSFTEIPFDSSGRFVMPETMAELGQIDDRIYFQGIGPFFTLWNPDQLETMGDGFEGAKAYCRKAVSDAEAKGGRK